VTDLWANGVCDAPRADELKKLERNVYSQNGGHGVVERIFGKIPPDAES
jgi:hypothetical protein